MVVSICYEIIFRSFIYKWESIFFREDMKNQTVDLNRLKIDSQWSSLDFVFFCLA